LAYNQEKYKISTKKSKIEKFDQILKNPLFGMQKSFLNKYEQAKMQNSSNFALSFISEISGFVNAKFDSLLERYEKLADEKIHFQVELQMKKNEIIDMKKQYIKTNIELMKISQMPAHKASKTPMNKWSTKKFLTKKSELTPNKIIKNEDSNLENQKNAEILETKILIKNEKCEENIIKTNNLKLENQKDEFQKNANNKMPENLLLVQPIEIKTENSKEEIKNTENLPVQKSEIIKPEINEEKIILEKLAFHIEKMKTQLTSNLTNTVINEGEIKFTNMEGQHMEYIMSFLMMKYNEQINEKYDILPTELYKLCELLFCSDYMMLEVCFTN